MRQARLVLVLFALCMFYGCTKTYVAGPLSKNPDRLTLYPSGDYQLRTIGIIIRYNETGRWWRVEGDVVVLAPSDPTMRERFVRLIERDRPLKDDFEVYYTLRSALANQELPEPTRKTLVDDWFVDPTNKQGSAEWDEIDPTKYGHGYLGKAPPGVQVDDLFSDD